jgi:hypothetical protein
VFSSMSHGMGMYDHDCRVLVIILICFFFWEFDF